jgi:hypothetical protein
VVPIESAVAGLEKALAPVFARLPRDVIEGGAGPAIIDLLAGQVQVMFASMSSSIEYVRAGKLRALAATTATRSPVLPDVPTVAPNPCRAMSLASGPASARRATRP